ncbi:hypothetical protein [Phenylobacterium sp.]|uniref:hypothetical protein n=1 Tax=Phenylobacterium sp. TaxID=1871053 RepID=UPI003561DC1F
MPKLNDAQIANALGVAKPAAAPAPDTPVGKAMAETQAMDSTLTDFVEKNRAPGESHAKAFDRVMLENPALGDRYQLEKTAILKRYGIGDLPGASGAS